jgi:molecular chaperone HscB
MFSQNYYDLFDIPVSFNIDLEILKKKYFKLSRSFHPDFYVSEREEVQKEMQIKSEYVNKAYRILSDRQLRLKYILELHNLLPGSENNAVSTEFLMRIMEMNETIDSLGDVFDSDTYAMLIKETDAIEYQLNSDVNEYIDHFEAGLEINIALQKIKEYYLKNRYLLRIRENLATFASAQE